MRFIAAGDKVKATMRFRGREMMHQQIGLELLQRLKADIIDEVEVEAEPKLEGRQMTMMLAPKRTNKTYFRFLNEIRIENACKLLASNRELSIAEIADNTGFNNISNFNRQFKTIKTVTPSYYRKSKRMP